MDDEYNENRSIKSGDKLNYKQVVQNNISEYLASIGTFGLGRCVKSLRNSVFFEIPGLPFRSEILKKEKELEFDRAVKISYIKRTNVSEWAHPYKKMIHLATINECYDMALGEFLLELVAKFDGLMGVKGFTQTGEERHDTMGDEIKLREEELI